ncbi:transcriptional regulator [Actinomadura macrotermitis]|uniref:Uncharacterized protein n=1 Tax=Actinomadura macrotermitis TaxID=2585200 RepID=A0A7K0BQL4_9ACTN|nr:transcriptional regulator [Actinomadura macrotermitis]MQY03326.1 hypothetical protein [Actinomadura macrotermitis]
MSADKKLIGARLRAAREAVPYWSRAELARRLRAAADPRERPGLPHVASLVGMIKQWEAGKYVPGRRYRALYARVLDRPEDALFPAEHVPRDHTWRPAGLDGAVTPDDEERITQAVARPVRLDAGTLDVLATVLAAQRRFEDATGPAALLSPVREQLDAITAMLREASGPLRDRLGSAVAEWTVYAGWLHAAIRQDAGALGLFGRGEDLADEFEDGVIAAVATSFRGYVARRQGRPQGVVRASHAALASPGAHPAQRTFDLLQAAQGHAMLGDRAQARRLLDQAAERAADAIEPPPPIYWYSAPFFQLNIGMVLNRIGEHADAAALLGEGLRGMPADQRDAEWLGEYREAQAEAHAHA